MLPLVFKTSVGFARVPGGFDSHSPPPFFHGQWHMLAILHRLVLPLLLVTGGTVAVIVRREVPHRRGRGGARSKRKWSRCPMRSAACRPVGTRACLLRRAGMRFPFSRRSAPEPRTIKVQGYQDRREERTGADLIREVTIGGVVLLESGKLRRTYTGEPPSLCPT